MDESAVKSKVTFFIRPKRNPVSKLSIRSVTAARAPGAKSTKFDVRLIGYTLALNPRVNAQGAVTNCVHPLF